MDGTLAVIFALTSLADMALNDCPTGCLVEGRTVQRLSFQTGATEFQEDFIGTEIYAGYDMGRTYGPFQPTMAISVTDTGDTWLGVGAKWTSNDILTAGPLFVETSLMPGIYFAGDGPDIGGAMQFRSAFGIGYALGNGATVSVLYDHRSNADTQNLNPGLETLSIRYAIAF
ncbi:acyloxyacyl hydrolase [Yoonia sp. 208BN28-4]|uniref:acyloxyacyl hydrolase n=1 Tax=Yoonia sp. 208BN28-4 TaxID=3126505 RepID=UPI0030B54F85